MAKVDILLATYNGAKYIRSQIMSIICQSFEDWRLIIHDDGSTDETVAIIKRIVDPRIVLIEDEKKFGNPCGNFLYLTQFIESPYAMFCDQDDIGWITRSKFCMMQFKAILPMNRWSAIPSLICGFPKPESRVWVRILNSTVHSIIYYSITEAFKGALRSLIRKPVSI